MNTPWFLEPKLAVGLLPCVDLVHQNAKAIHIGSLGVPIILKNLRCHVCGKRRKGDECEKRE